MPFCPKCGTEYVTEATTCSECSVLLVEKMENPTEPIEKWVPLQNLPGLVYAEMVKEVLDQRNIPCYIQSDIWTGAYGVKSASVVGAKCVLFVPKEMKQIAENILHQMVDHI
jgi:hypothetical protein